MLGFLLVLDTFAQAQPQTDMFFILLIVFLHECNTYFETLYCKEKCPTDTDRQTDRQTQRCRCLLVGLVWF